MTVAIQYLRRSSDKQDDSTEQQRKINDEYVEKMGYELLDPKGVWEETGSGRTFDDRPVFQALVKAVERREVVADVLIMYRPSRFGRSEDLTEFYFYEHRFKKMGVRIEFASGPEYNMPGLGGLIIKGVAYSAAAEFSKDLSNYATRGLVENARLGYSTGGDPCLGYERVMVEAATGKEIGRLPRGAQKGADRKLKIKYVFASPNVVEFVREHIFERPCRNGWSYAKTARELNKLVAAGTGLPSPRAGRVIHRRNGNEVPYTGTWKAGTIRAMWTCKTYIGFRVIVIGAENAFHGQRVECEGAHEPLITLDVFRTLYERAQRLPWNERKLVTGPRRRRKPAIYAMSGIGKCVHCAFGFSGARSTNRKKRAVQNYYRDSGETNGYCTVPSWSIPVGDFDAWVKAKIEERLRSPHFQDELLAMLRARHAPTSAEDPTAPLRARRVEVQTQIDKLIDLASRATSQSTSLAKRLDALEGEVVDLDRRLLMAADQRRVAVRDADLLAAAKKITDNAVRLVQSDGEVLHELAPRFIKEFRVNKETRTIEVEFYTVPAVVIDRPPRSRIEKMETDGIEPSTLCVQSRCSTPELRPRTVPTVRGRFDGGPGQT